MEKSPCLVIYKEQKVTFGHGPIVPRAQIMCARQAGPLPRPAGGRLGAHAPPPPRMWAPPQTDRLARTCCTSGVGVGGGSGPLSRTRPCPPPKPCPKLPPRLVLNPPQRMPPNLAPNRQQEPAAKFVAGEPVKHAQPFTVMYLGSRCICTCTCDLRCMTPSAY